jgi:hypothetical protein
MQALVIFVEIQLKDVCAYAHIVAKETPVNAVFLMQLQVAVNDQSMGTFLKQ